MSNYSVGPSSTWKRLREIELGLCKESRTLSPEDVVDAHALGLSIPYMSVQRAAVSVLEAAGVDGARDLQGLDLYRRLHNTRGIGASANTSADLSGIFANVQNKALIKGFNRASPTWRQWCRKGSLANFQLSKRVQLSDMGQLRETGENGEILDSKLSDRSENIQLAYYARSVSFTDQMFINDDLRALVDPAERMGRGAASLVSRLVYTHLLANGNMGDGNALFEATYHKNYLSGGSSPLAYTSLGTAVQLFRQQVAPKAPNDTEFPDEPTDIAPRFLLVPPELETTAKNICGVAIARPDGTEFSDISSIGFIRSLGITPLVEPRLSHTGYTGYSTTAWYLAGDPEDVDTVEVAFLNNKEEPDTMGFSDFGSLCHRFRAVLACGVKALDWRGLVKSAGA